MRKLLALLLLLLTLLPVTAHAAGPPVYAGKLGEVFLPNFPAGTSHTVSVTVAAGADIALVVKASLESTGAGATITGCVFNTTETMTQVVANTANVNEYVSWWVLFNPTVTTADVVCAYNTSVTNEAEITVFEYTNATATGAINTATATNAAPSVGVTTVGSDSLVLATFYSGWDTFAPFTPNAGITERNDSAGNGADQGWGEFEATATTPGIVTVGAVAASARGWWGAAFELRSPVAAASGPGLFLTLLGAGGGIAGAVTPPPAGCTILMAAGSTDAQIIAQLAAAPDGSTLCLTAGETVIVSNPLQMDISQRSLTLDCQGSTLQRNAATPVVFMQGSETATSNFTLSGQTVTWTELPAGLAAGDWIKLSADDPLPGGAGASTSSRPRLGQAVQVASVAGSASVFSGALTYSGSYATNRRADKIQSKGGTIRRCRILGNAAQTTWQQPSIQVTNAISPLVELDRCVTGVAGCVNFTNTVAAVARDIDCRNLTAGTLATNTCVHADASLNTQASGIYAENTRKPFDVSANDIAASAASLADYGAAWNATELDAVCYLNNGADGCFGYGSEGQGGIIQRGYGFNGVKCIVAAGLNYTIRDSFCMNMTLGIELRDAVSGAATIAGDDGQGILIDHVSIREISGAHAGITATNSPTNNRICSSRIEVFDAFLNNTVSSQNLGSCTYLSGQVTFFNDILATNVTTTPENLGCNTCDDIIPAGTGNDTIDALAGNDLVWGGTGSDTITLGAGVDRLAYFWTDEAADTVTDFAVGAGGDVIDVGWFLARAAGANYTGNPVTDGYVSTTQVAGDCKINLDPDGTAGGTAATTVATLTGVTCSNLIAANWRYTLR